MAEQTTSSIVIDAAPADIMAVIGDFAAYPEWAKGVTKAEVAVGRTTTAGPSRSSSRSTSARSRTSTRSPTSGTATTRSPGPWSRARCCARSTAPTCSRTGATGRTEVTYRLALDVSIPLIGMLKRKGEKILIDTALKGLKKRVESLG